MALGVVEALAIVLTEPFAELAPLVDCGNVAAAIAARGAEGACVIVVTASTADALDLARTGVVHLLERGHIVRSFGGAEIADVTPGSPVELAVAVDRPRELMAGLLADPDVSAARFDEEYDPTLVVVRGANLDLVGPRSRARRTPRWRAHSIDGPLGSRSRRSARRERGPAGGRLPRRIPGGGATGGRLRRDVAEKRIMTARAVLAGANLGIGRALAPRLLLAMLAAFVVTVLLALAEKRASLPDAATRALLGAAFGLVIPVFALFSTGVVLAGARLDDATTPLALLGAPRKAAALGLSFSVAAESALAASIIALLTTLVAHDPLAPPVVTDMVSAAWIGALTACAYSGLFTFGSTWGARGGGRAALFMADWVLGGANSLGNVILPRAHTQNLLGGEPPFLFSHGLSQGASALVLGAIACALTLAAVARCRP